MTEHCHAMGAYNMEKLSLLIAVQSLTTLILSVRPETVTIITKTVPCGSIRNNTFIQIGNLNESPNIPFPLIWNNVNQPKSSDPIMKFCYPNSLGGNTSESQSSIYPKAQPQFSASPSHLTWNDSSSGVVIIDKSQASTYQQVRHGIVFDIGSCSEYLPSPSQAIIATNHGQYRVTRQKPFALVHINPAQDQSLSTSKFRCKCQNYLLTETTELQEESNLWVVNGVLIEIDAIMTKTVDGKSTILRHYCLHRESASSVQNFIHVYRVSGVIEIQPNFENHSLLSHGQKKSCDGLHVTPSEVYEMWTESSHPCGKSAFQQSKKSEGTPICLIEPEQKLQGRTYFNPWCKPPLLPEVQNLPLTCGPVDVELRPSVCHITCHRNGPVSLPGGCYMYGRCHFTRGEFVLYVTKCPSQQRYDRKLKKCVAGRCLTPEKNKREQKHNFKINRQWSKKHGHNMHKVKVEITKNITYLVH